MIRLAARAAINLLANAVGLIVANLLLEDLNLNVAGASPRSSSSPWSRWSSNR